MTMELSLLLLRLIGFRERVSMFHYTSCGLRNIWLRNGYVERSTSYGKAVAIHDVEGLHKAIGLFLVKEKPRLSSAEVRFLRKELDMPQVHLAQVLGVGETTVRAWEASRAVITRPAERFLRALYLEHVEGDGTIRALVERLSQINRDDHHKRIEMSETDSGWLSRAA